MISLRPEEHRSVAQYVYSLCGVALDESKAYLIENRLGGLVEESGCGSFSGLLLRAKSDSSRALNRRIIDAITTNETFFFRDTAPFDLLRHKIVPELIDRLPRTRSASIRIWSAACSTGQELYSIAILLKELLGDVDRYGIQLLGTDISDQAVAQASRGRFTAIEISRGLSDALRDRYFVARGGEWQIRDDIRGMACFKKLNLLEDFSSLGRFDIIFCRNVAIYFTEQDKVALFGRIGRALDRDGFLVVGGMESLAGSCPQFESKRHLRTVFYQLKSGVVGPQAAAGFSR